MKIICIGRSYATHAEELNNDLPKEPIVFMKPDSALLRENKPFFYPEFTQDINFECEFVLRFRKPGKYIPEEFALDYVESVGLGIDFTARDLQAEAKEQGLPWEKAKAFNDSAPISELIPVEEFDDLQDVHFELDVNGATRQKGHTAKMTFSIPTLISHVSKYFMLKTGDLLFTGTPEGVGPIAVGDRLVGRLEGREMFDFEIK